MSILLKGRNIEHSYREGKIVTPVLKGVNLDIQASRMTAIVGKSGSGKSTLLHILGTLDTPTKGEIVFKDTVITALSDRQKAHFRNRHLGFIYQFHHLLDDFSVLENVMLPLLIAHAEKDLAKSRATYLLERVGLSDRLRYLPSELSGGERQRVAIARALVHSPELILADEPTGNLDEGNAATVFNLFRELVNDEKTAVVMVTHDLSLARQCDEILEMQGGVVLSRPLPGENELEASASFRTEGATTSKSHKARASEASMASRASDEADITGAASARAANVTRTSEIESVAGSLSKAQVAGAGTAGISMGEAQVGAGNEHLLNSCAHQFASENASDNSAENTSKTSGLASSAADNRGNESSSEADGQHHLKSSLLEDTSEVETIEEDGSTVIFLQHDGSNHALEEHVKR